MLTKENCIAVIDSFIKSGFIRKEDIIKEYSGKHCCDGLDIQAKQYKEEVVEYLNGVTSSNRGSLGKWCRERKYPVDVYKTLELCLVRGKFSFKRELNGRMYYVKDSMSLNVEERDIVQKSKKVV